MEKIHIGKITSAVGIKGEVKVYNYSDSDDIYRTVDAVYAGKDLVKVEKVRTQKNMVVLKLSGIDDRNAAEAMRDTDIFITEDDLPELPEGQFYVRDLIGMEVAEEDGNLIGTVTDVIQNTAQDVLEIETPEGRQVLIPKVDQFVLSIGKDERKITVRLIEGLLDL